LRGGPTFVQQALKKSMGSGLEGGRGKRFQKCWGVSGA
jgi:hypothetical protein